MDALRLRQRILLNQPHIETKIGSESSTEITHFKTDMKAPLKECKVYFNPIQEGSGDPSSDNIRDFLGWTEVWIGYSGVNLLYCDSPDYYINKNETGDGIASTLTRNTDGEIEAITFNGTTTSTNVFRNLNYTPDSPSEITMPSGKIALTTYSSQVYIIPMGNNDVPRTINGKAWHQSYIDTLDNWTVWDVDSYENYNGLWIRAQVFPQQKDLSIDTTIYPMMCLAEDKGCEFEPYKGNDYSISWEKEVGIVYGGYVDFVSGELVSEWDYIESYNGEAINTEWISDRDVYVEGGVPTTGAEVIYKLSEPIIYQLTPQQLVTYKGVNNIWPYTNGQAEVKYWTYKPQPKEKINYLNYVVWSEAGYIGANGKETIQATSASHFFKNPILLKAGTYNLNGFSNYVGSDNTRYRIHEYNQNGSWVKQITYQQIDNLSPVDINFTLDKDTYVKLSIAMAFEGTLTKVS